MFIRNKSYTIFLPTNELMIYTPQKIQTKIDMYMYNVKLGWQQQTFNTSTCNFTSFSYCVHFVEYK